MLDELEPRQLSEWFAYYRIEPFGESWKQAGTIAATIHNETLYTRAASGDKPTDADRDSPEDYMPRFEERERPERGFTPDQHRQQMDAWSRGGK